MRKIKLKPTIKRTSERIHRHAFLLNEEEEKALTRYIQKYHVKNTSKFIRETLITTILHRCDEDHPTLF